MGSRSLFTADALVLTGLGSALIWIRRGQVCSSVERRLRRCPDTGWDAFRSRVSADKIDLVGSE